MPVLPKTFKHQWLWSTTTFCSRFKKVRNNRSSSSMQQFFYGRLKIQATTVLYRYFESRQCRVREWEREKEKEKEKDKETEKEKEKEKDKETEKEKEKEKKTDKKKKKEKEKEKEKKIKIKIKKKKKKRKRKRKRKKNRKKQTEIFWMISLFAERFFGKDVEVKLVLRYICKIIQHPSSSQNGST